MLAFIKKFSKIHHCEKFQFKEVARKFPTSYFVSINKLMLSKLIWKVKGLKGKKKNPEEEQKDGRLTAPTDKTYYKAIVIKTVRYWQKNTSRDQWNRTECPEIDPHRYSLLIFSTGAKTVQWRKDSLYNK